MYRLEMVASAKRGRKPPNGLEGAIERENTRILP
jgi:hypothetical protein